MLFFVMRSLYTLYTIQYLGAFEKNTYEDEFVDKCQEVRKE